MKPKRKKPMSSLSFLTIGIIVALGLIAIMMVGSLTILPLSYAQTSSSSSSQPTQQSTTATPQADSAPTTSGSIISGPQPTQQSTTATPQAGTSSSGSPPISGSQSILPSSSSSSSPSSQSEGRAQTENFHIDSVADNTRCGGELVDISGDVQIVTQSFERQDGSFHITQHVNFADVKGVGEESGVEYRASENFNSESNFDIDETGSATHLTTLHLISVSPVQQPNLTIQTLLHVAINSNGDATSLISNFRSTCM